MPENDIKKKAEQLSAEVAAAKQQAATAEQKAASLENEVKEQKTTIEAQKTSIDNLDASMKQQSATIAELKKQLAGRKASGREIFREALEEKKSAIEAGFKDRKNFSVNIELKNVVDITTAVVNPNQVLGMQADPTIHGAAYAPNVFLQVFGIRPRTGNKLTWIEATAQTSADYISELTANSNKSDVVFAERTRAFAKIGHYFAISTEMEDWFDQLFNYCVNEGSLMVDAKIDAEVCAGAGDDSDYPNKVYGLKGQATAFSALAASAIKGATVADVILDAADQIKKEGFNANAAFLTWALYRQLKNLKDDVGNYIFDKLTGMLDGIKIYPTSRLSSGEILVADSSCVEIYGGNSFELEFDRNASVDGYNVYFRKAVQVKVPAAKKKGLIYVASASTAIAALNSSTGTVGAGVASIATATSGIKTDADKLAGAVNNDGQIETHPNS